MTNEDLERIQAHQKAAAGRQRRATTHAYAKDVGLLLGALEETEATVEAARKAAQHLRYCEFAGTTIEYRCKNCPDAVLFLRAEGGVEP